MALQLSTGLRAKQECGAVAKSAFYVTGTDIAAVDGSGGDDTITRTAADFVTAGFIINDRIIVQGFTGGNVTGGGPYTLTGVAAATLTMATASLVASDAAGEAVTITILLGGSLRDIFRAGVLKIYTGTQPTTADYAATGTLLVTITRSSGTVTPGSAANGLNLDTTLTGVIAKISADVWSGVAVATGTAGWFRLYANATDADAISTTLPRLDGSIATSGAQLNMSSTSITSGATITLDTFTITLPGA